MTRTTERRVLRAAPACAAVLFLLFPISSSAAAAPQPAGQRFFMGVAAGYFRPLQASFRKIYDKPAWPLELRLGWAAKPHLDLFAAVRFMQADGNTVLLNAWKPRESYALRLRLLALRLGASFYAGDGPIVPYLGAGIQYVSFKEEWLATPLETSGSKAGFFVHWGGRLRLARSLHLLAQLEYSHLPAGEGDRGQKVNLGGLCLSLGVRVGIF